MEASSLNFNVFNSLILAGILQGLVFGVIVASSKKYRFTNTLLLAAFIVSFSLDNLQYLLEDIGLISREQLFAFWFIPFELLSGTLFLLYGLHVIYPGRQWRQKDKLFFLPFTIVFVVTSLQKIVFGFGLIDKQQFLDTEIILEFTAITIDLSVLLYLCLLTFRYWKNNAVIGPQLRWFKNVLLLLLVLSIAWFVVSIADYFYDTDYWYVVYLSMSIVIYWLGHAGIYKFGMKEEGKKIRPFVAEHKDIFSPEKKNDHMISLENLLLHNKRFLDPKITLDNIAEELNLSKTHLSRTINAELGMGFPDYLNSFRVEEAKIYLQNAEFSNYTLLAIGLEAGFNSKTTFYTAFKKATALTPSEFRKSAAN